MGATSAMLAVRPTTLDGCVLGLLDNNKQGGRTLLGEIARLLGERFNLRGVVWASKAEPTTMAQDDVLAGLARDAAVVVTAIGD